MGACLRLVFLDQVLHLFLQEDVGVFLLLSLKVQLFLELSVGPLKVGDFFLALFDSI